MEVSFEEVVRRKKLRLSNSIEQTDEILALLIAKQDWKKIAFNVHVVTQSAICLGMLQARVDKNFYAAISTFSSGKAYSRELLQLVRDGDKFPQDSLADIQKNRELAANFEFPIYCSLMSGDIDLAAKLAQAVVKIKYSQEPNWFELTSHLLSAFVLDDHVLFESLWLRYNKLKLLYGQELLNVYLKLYESVIKRDKTQYISLLEKAAENFKLRGTDKKLGDISSQYGGTIENAFVLDFMALGIAVLASHRGMDANMDTEFFPQQLLKLIRATK